MSDQYLNTTEFPQILQNGSQLSFSWYDYVLFSMMLLLSAIIGIYFGCFGSKQSSTDEYLMGNRRMKIFPVSVSLIASHISGVTLLAVPADIYRYGGVYWLFIPSMVIVCICTIYIYLPVFYKLQITSTYEYLGRRFDSPNRLLASFLFALGVFLYLPIVIYIPALAFSAATGISLHYITIVVCGVCIFYTTIGGLKAVVWTDTLQFLITVGAVFTVVVIGIRSAGGFGAVLSKAWEGHRLDILDFDPDPTKRDSFFTVIIGISIAWMAKDGVHQSVVQKFLSVSTFREAKLTVIFFAVGIIMVGSFSVFTGLIMYSRYSTCDPLTTGAVKKHDQLLPYYIMDVASHIPGLSGLFIAGIFCSALSTLSACLNCLAGTMYEDFVVKFIGAPKSEKRATYILKLLVVASGISCTALVFVVERLGGILPLVISLGGVTWGPLLGMFTLGVLFPRASSKGTFYGTILSLLVSSWVVTMAQYYKAKGVFPDVPKPVSIEGCPELINTTFSVPSTNFNMLPGEQTTMGNFKFSADIFNNSYVKDEERDLDNKPFFLFRISFYYYAPFGLFLTVMFGLSISYLFKNDDPPVHRDLLSPVIYFMLSEEKSDTGKHKEYYSVQEALQIVDKSSKLK